MVLSESRPFPSFVVLERRPHFYLSSLPLYIASSPCRSAWPAFRPSHRRSERSYRRVRLSRRAEEILGCKWRARPNYSMSMWPVYDFFTAAVNEATLSCKCTDVWRSEKKEKEEWAVGLLYTVLITTKSILSQQLTLHIFAFRFSQLLAWKQHLPVCMDRHKSQLKSQS